MARPNFVELPTNDVAVSKKFYEQVFRWKMTDFGPTYASTSPARLIGGCRGTPPNERKRLFRSSRSRTSTPPWRPSPLLVVGS